MTIAMQLGFIAGALVFAWLAIADRFSPRLVFFLSTLAGASATRRPDQVSRRACQ